MFQRLFSQLVLPLLIVGIGAAGLVWLSAKDTPPARTAQKLTPPLVETVALPSEIPEFQIQVGGNVVPSREVTLSAQVDGAVILKAESIESGRHVLSSTPLMQLDRSRFELQADKAASELKQVEADLRQLLIEHQGTKALIELAEREVELAEATSNRVKSLIAKDAGSTAELETVERAELQSRNTLRQLINENELIPIRQEQLETKQRLAKYEQSLAQLNLAHSTIHSPFDGIITSVLVEQGDYVQTGDPLLTLVDMSTLDVECSLQLEDLYWLWNVIDIHDHTSPHDEDAMFAGPGRVFEIPSADARVTCEVAGREFHWSGQLSRYEGAGINRRTRTVACRVRVSQPIRSDEDDGPTALMRGMYVTVTLDIKPRADLLRIPTAGVQPNDQVLTVEDGVLRVHKIRPARVLADSVLVRADATDLKPGDRIVVTTLVSPIDGVEVREITRNATEPDVPGPAEGKSR